MYHVFVMNLLYLQLNKIESLIFTSVMVGWTKLRLLQIMFP